MFDTLWTRITRFPEEHYRLFLASVAVVAMTLTLVIGGSIWYMADIFRGLPDAAELRGIGSMDQATTLFDVKGRTAFTVFREQRTDVPLSRVSPHLIHAIIAVEDQHFYEHKGVDLVRIAGAALSNIHQGRAAQGASTITQQLARQSFLSPDKTMRRKLKEVVLAERLERQFTKPQILELYLNKVYFGDGLYGVEAASLGYFGRHAADLDLAQAALLAGLTKSPSTYAPTVRPERALARRGVVLRAMLDSKAIDRASYDKAVHQELGLNDTLRREEAYGQYFKEEVRKELVQRFGWDRVYQGGLKVFTTVDLDMQKAADTEVHRAIDEIEARQAQLRGKRPPLTTEPLQAALVALDPVTGEVRAMVGGRDFDKSHFNRATQARRQPGSAFKPFVYAAAIEQGYTPATLISGLDEPIGTLQGAWIPEDEHLDSPTLTMRAALRTSSNRAAVQMLQQVGIQKTVRQAQRFGLGDVPGVPSLALGSGEVTLMSMATAYSAFANSGMLNTPTLIRRVESADGEVLYSSVPSPTRAVNEATAFILTSMMADVVDAGTGSQARRVGFLLPAAGKTGTTNDYHDAWFVGFTPHLVTGVWVGYDQPRTIIGNGYAGTLAVPFWGRFMRAATSQDKPDWFRAPATVTPVAICRLSGKLPADGCRDAEIVDRKGQSTRGTLVYTEYFVRGTEPVELCDLHRPRSIWNTIASAVGLAEPRPQPVAAAEVGTGGAVTPVAGDRIDPGSPVVVRRAPDATTPTDATTKKRGFWSKVFGRDGDGRREKGNSK